jgi:putative chitobiose transport system substrate-binding protein
MGCCRLVADCQICGMNRSRCRWMGYLLSTILLSSLAACGGNAPRQSGEIEFWTMQLQPKFTPFFKKLIQQFERENPGVTVRWVDIPWQAMESKILTAVAANTAPDVVNLNPGFASQLANRQALLTLNGRLTPDQQAQYLPNIWQASSLEGKTFGLPWYLTTRVAIFNQALLQQAGLRQPPATFAELATAARQLKAKTGKYAFFVTFVPEDSAEVLESFIQMGVPLLDAQGKAAFNTPAGKAAFQFWVDLYQQGLLPQEVLTQGHRRAIELYQAGELALVQTGPEFLNSITTNAPAIARVSVAAPQITGSTGKKNVAVMNLVIPKDTPNPKDALKFALFVTNSPNQLAFAREGNVLPSTTTALRAYQQHLQQKSADNPALTQARWVSARQIDQAQVLIPAQRNSKALQKIVYDNLQAAMLGRKTVDQAVQDAADAWDRRI